MNEKESKFKFWDKLKKIKHIEIYIAILFIVILLLIYLSTTKTTKVSSSNNTNEITISSYIDNLETNLEKTLSNIAEIGRAHV